MKLWSRNGSMEKEVERFTIGQDPQLDTMLAPYDILGSIAHALMLTETGLIARTEGSDLVRVLRDIYQSTRQNSFIIEKGIEDVHSQVEMILTRELGETGKKIHTGRSRNDQVLLDLRLFTRDQLEGLVNRVKDLFDKLMVKSEAHRDDLMPGYTHMQAAMPSSYGLWFAAFAESLVDDSLLLECAYRITNQNPLGSAAGYGTSLPISRQRTTELLGFENLLVNVVYAQMTRGKVEAVVLSACASVARTIGRMAHDIVLYSGEDFRFFTADRSVTTGSSMMPHKRNPDVFELIRAKCNTIQALTYTNALLTTNLSTGYHRDLQMLKEHYLPMFGTLAECIDMMAFALDRIQVNKDIIKQDKYKYIFSLERVNELVRRGVSFREAYHQVSLAISDGQWAVPEMPAYTHEGSIHNLCNHLIKQRMDRVLGLFPFRDVRDRYQFLLEGTV